MNKPPVTSSIIPSRAEDSDQRETLPALRIEDHYVDHGPSRYVEDEPVNWRNVVALLVRRRKIILTVFGLVLAATILKTATTPRVYQASAKMLIKSDSNNSMSRLATDLPAIGSMLQFTEQDSQETQVQILQSTSTQDAAMRLLSDSDRNALKGNHTVSVTPVQRTEVIQVAVSSTNANAAKAFTNAICDAYLDQGQTDNSSVYSVTADYVRKQLRDVDAQLMSVSQQLMKFKQANNIVDLDAEGQKRIEALAAIRSQLVQAETERRAGVAQLGQLRTSLSGVSPSIEASRTTVASPVVGQLQSQLTQLEVQRVTLAQEYTPQSPEYRDVVRQIDGIKSRLKREASTVVGTSSVETNPLHTQLVQNIQAVQAQNWANESRAQALAAEAARIESGLKVLPKKQLELGQLQMRVQTLQQTYQALDEKYQTLRISEQAPFTNARIISPAESALQVSPSWRRSLPMGFIVGLVLAVAIAALIDFWDDRVYSEKDVQDATGLNVLCQVPMLRATNGITQSRILPGQNTNLLLESYRMLRTQLDFAAITSPIRSIVLTSSQPHEGKSTAAVNLATVLALDGKKVVLVDCDLRNPSLANSLEISNRVGFTSVLSGNAVLEDALKETNIPNLIALPAGPTPPNPPELLNSKAASDLLTKLRDMADILIIDTPPSLIMSDANVLARWADGTILVVSSNEAGKREVSRTVETLRMSGTRLLGVILNKIDLEAGGYYGYYSQYGYYRRYGYKYEKYGLSQAEGAPGNGSGPMNPQSALGQGSEGEPRAN